MNYGLTVGEKKQLLALLDKIQANHCKNYHSNNFDWNCVRESDNKVCPIEYEADAEYLDCNSKNCFYCPVFLIRNVMEDNEDNQEEHVSLWKLIKSWFC